MSNDCERLGLAADVCRALASDQTTDGRTTTRPATSWTSSWTLPATPTTSRPPDTTREARPSSASSPISSRQTTSSASPARSSSTISVARTTQMSLYTPPTPSITPLQSSTSMPPTDVDSATAEQAADANKSVNSGAIVAPFVVIILILLTGAGYWTWRRWRRKRHTALLQAGGDQGDTEKLWLAQPAETVHSNTAHAAEWLGIRRPPPPPPSVPKSRQAPHRPPRPSVVATSSPVRSNSAKRVPPPVVRESALLAAATIGQSALCPPSSPASHSPALDSPSSFACRGDRRTIKTLAPLPPLPTPPARPLPAVTTSPTTGRLESSRPTTLFSDEDERPLAYAMRPEADLRYNDALRSKLHPPSLVPGRAVVVPVRMSEAPTVMAEEDWYGVPSDRGVSLPRSLRAFSVASGDEEELVPSRSRSKTVWPAMRPGALDQPLEHERGYAL